MKLITDSGEEFPVSKLQLSEDDIIVIEGVSESEACDLPYRLAKFLGIENKILVIAEGTELGIVQKAPCGDCPIDEREEKK